jgi:hypothetical protein
MEEKAKIAYNEYMKQYMKVYRNSKKGKKICNEAKERYYIKKYNEGIKNKGE